MNPVDGKPSTYFDYGVEHNDKYLKYLKYEKYLKLMIN